MTRVKCFQHVEEGPNEHGLQKDAVVPLWYWKGSLKTCSVYWRDGFILAISGVRANDFEQLMRGVCERVGLDNSGIHAKKTCMER